MLLGYTANGVAQLGLWEVGTIAPRQLVDLVMLERDLFAPRRTASTLCS